MWLGQLAGSHGGGPEPRRSWLCLPLTPDFSHAERRPEERERSAGSHQAQFSQSFLGAILLFHELYKEGEGNRLL